MCWCTCQSVTAELKNVLACLCTKRVDYPLPLRKNKYFYFLERISLVQTCGRHLSLFTVLFTSIRNIAKIESFEVRMLIPCLGWIVKLMTSNCFVF